MSRAFIKEDSEDLPSEELPERPLNNEPNYTTPEGYALLKAKVDKLAAEHAKLKHAAEDFDKPRLAEVERDLRYYQARVDGAIVVDAAIGPKDEIHFGATVKTEDEGGKVHTFTIVGEDETDVARGKVSWRSPLSKALIGARLGDTVTWQRPAGPTTLEILEVQYPKRRK
jgi:transcription elongation factor GreB